MLGFSGLCGLRTRSEIAALRWEHIHWDENTFTVPKCKTAERTVPIFGDFRSLLDAHHQICIAPDPMVVLSGPIFPNCPSQTQLTNRLNRTASKAGMQPWQKPWMNLRSSAETWLVRQGFDLTTVTGWLGNSPSIAQKHYLQVTPDDIAKASAMPVPEKFSNSFQSTGELGRIEGQEREKPSYNQGFQASQYIRRDSNPQPSVPKATLNTGQKARKLLVFQQFTQFLTRCKLSRLIAVIVGKSRYILKQNGRYRKRNSTPQRHRLKGFQNRESTIAEFGVVCQSR